MENFSSTKVFLEKWNGIDRLSDTWCQEQVALLADGILEAVDLDGIRALLTEMSQEKLMEAAKYSARILEHLFKITYSTLPEDNPVRDDWRGEVSNYRNDLLALFDECKNSDLKTTYRARLEATMWKLAKKFYVRDSKDYSDLVDGVNKIPEKNPFTVEMLMDCSIEELQSKL